MLAHRSLSTLGQYDNALARAIIPSDPIRQSDKLQHETCVDGVSCVQRSTVISLSILKHEEYILLHVLP